MRERTEERKWFTLEEKRKMLSKSNGKCCHCGRALDINFTVEHVIPLAKGGSNDAWNTVGLCEECNKKKADAIVDLRWYKYIAQEYMAELQDNIDKYFTEVEWIYKKNICALDKWEIAVKHYPNEFGNYGFSCKKPFSVIIKYVASRANYSDLDEIYNSVLKYNKKWGLFTDRVEMKDLISYYYSHGVFYILRNGSGELVGIVPFEYEIQDGPEDGDYTEICSEEVALWMRNPMCLSNKGRDAEALMEMITSIVGSLGSAEVYNGVVPLYVEYFYNDEVSRKIAYIMSDRDLVPREDTSFVTMLVYACTNEETYNEGNEIEDTVALRRDTSKRLLEMLSKERKPWKYYGCTREEKENEDKSCNIK